MSLVADAQNVLAQYERLASAGRMDSRDRMATRLGFSEWRYNDAHAYMVRNLLVGAQIAVRYDPSRFQWTAGAERYNGAAGYDEFGQFVGWHLSYLRTRSQTQERHQEAIAAAFPSKARLLRGLRRYNANLIAEIDSIFNAL